MANYGHVLIAPPEIEPVGLAEAKKQVEVAQAITYHDQQIESILIPAARLVVEQRTGRQLIEATWELRIDRFPPGPVRLPKSPVVRVVSVKYTGTDGNEETLEPESYYVPPGREPGEIRRRFGQSWPAVLDGSDGIAIQYVAGYGVFADDVPAPCRQAVLLLLAHWMNAREPVVIGSISKEIELTFAALCEACGVGDEFTVYG